MQVNRKLIIISIVSFLFVMFAILLTLFINNRNNLKSIQKETILLYDEEGIPSKDSTLFSWGGWNQVPNIDQLQNFSSSQNGGSINKVALYKDKKTNITYTKMEILGDYNTLLIYFGYTDSSGWFELAPEKISKNIRKSLDEKLQTPPVQPDKPIIDE